MIRVLHTGDLHLDSPFRGLSAEKRRSGRGGAAGGCWTRSPRWRKSAAQMWYSSLKRPFSTATASTMRLPYAGGGVWPDEGPHFHRPGQPRPYSDFSPYASVRWPDNVHIFHSDYFERVELPELNAVVCTEMPLPPNTVTPLRWSISSQTTTRV